MRRVAAVVLAIALTVTACTGGDGDGDGGKKVAGPSLPLPEKAPPARGPATGPALEPKVLLASTDDLEELAGEIDTAQVERRSDAFISGSTVVGYSVDDISGYDLESGEQLWTAKLDLGGGTVCYVSQPEKAVKTFTVVFGDGGSCPHLATIRVSDGSVVKTSERLNETTRLEGALAGGPVSHMFTVGATDYLVDLGGVVWKMVKGEPEPVTRLKDRSYYDLTATPEGDMVVGRLSTRENCRVDAYALPSFEPLWSQDNSTLFPEVTQDCSVTTTPDNPTWLAQETDDTSYLVQVDPRTGEVLGRTNAPKDSGGKMPEGQFDVSSASNQLEEALGLPGGDTVFSQVRGLTRYSLESGNVVWDLDLDQLSLESTEEFPMDTVLPQGITSDGYLVASVSNDTAVEILAIDVDDGTLVGRWPVPKEYRNGFQVEPGMTLFDDGIVLTRNFEAWEFAFRSYMDVQEPDGDRFDIGVFTFPDPNQKQSKAVPTAGPVDTEAKAIGGLPTPADVQGDRDAGAVDSGTGLVAYAGNLLSGLDPVSGEQRWKLAIDADPGARVCTVGRPDRTVKTVTVAVRGSADGALCGTLLRVATKDGTVVDRVDVPPATKGVSRIVVEAGVVYVVTGDKRIGRLADGALVPYATLAHQPYYLERTPQDPTLLVSTAPVRGGKDWAIEGYRLPAFDRVWATSARAAFGAVDRENYVDAWRGNGLWVSTTLGDVSKSGGTVKDVLALLDPATGEVVTRMGPTKREYSADDPATFSLSDGVVGSFETAGLDDGDVLVPQTTGVMRYSLAEQKVRWSLDTRPITEAMLRERGGSLATDHTIDLIEDGKTVLVTLSNDTSVEVMTVRASDGRITGRWNVSEEFRNGLQTSPQVTPVDGGVALSHSDYPWDYAFVQQGRTVPPQQRYDVGLFRLKEPARKK